MVIKELEHLFMLEYSRDRNRVIIASLSTLESSFTMKCYKKCNHWRLLLSLLVLKMMTLWYPQKDKKKQQWISKILKLYSWHMLVFIHWLCISSLTSISLLKFKSFIMYFNGSFLVIIVRKKKQHSNNLVSK